MDVLRYRVLNTLEGATSVASGINFSQIIKVCRQGLQFDFTSVFFLETSNRCWSFFGTGKRILFKSDSPFGAGEKVFVIYKVTT